MRLGMVTHRLIAGEGQGRVNIEIVKEALRRGHAVTVVSSDCAPDLCDRSGLRWHPVPSSHRWPALIGVIAFASRSATCARRHRTEVDLLHSNGFTTWEPAEVNAAHHVHSAWLRSPMHTSRQRGGLYGAYHRVNAILMARLERRAYRNARRIVAVSEKVRRELIEIGVPDERVTVILNGVDTCQFHPGDEDRSDLGLPADSLLALFVGDIRTPGKNLDGVLHALTRVPRLQLAVVGDTLRSPYPAMAHRLGLGERVRFLGYRTDVPQLMRAADLFVFPSRYEACSLVLLEAFASGLPVVTARTAGAAEMLTPNAGVVLADPEDRDALTTAIQTLLDDPERRACMGQAARAVAERHTWAAMADAYLQLYQEILA